MIAERPRAWDTAGTALPVIPPRFALFELAVFLFIALAEWLWEPFPDLNRLNPHPYWIPVLLLSLQYGTVSGLLAAAIAIAGSVLIGVVEPEIGESYFAFLVRTWSQPVLWLVVALLVGAFRMRQIEYRDDLEAEVADLRARSLALVDHADNLKGRCDLLERRLAADSGPQTDRLLDAFGMLAEARGDGWGAALDSALDIVVPGAQASVFAVKGEDLALVHAHRWAEGAKWRREMRGAEPLAQAVLGEARALTILSAIDERMLAGEGLFAVPVIDPNGGAVVGLLKIETIGAKYIEAALTPRLAVLAAHLAPVLAARGASGQIARPRLAEPAARASAPRLKLWSPIGSAGAGRAESREVERNERTPSRPATRS